MGINLSMVLGIGIGVLGAFVAVDRSLKYERLESTVCASILTNEKIESCLIEGGVLRTTLRPNPAGVCIHSSESGGLELTSNPVVKIEEAAEQACTVCSRLRTAQRQAPKAPEPNSTPKTPPVGK